MLIFLLSSANTLLIVWAGPEARLGEFCRLLPRLNHRWANLSQTVQCAHVQPHLNSGCFPKNWLRLHCASHVDFPRQVMHSHEQWMLESTLIGALEAWHCTQLTPWGTRKHAVQIKGQLTSLLTDETQARNCSVGHWKQVIQQKLPRRGNSFQRKIANRFSVGCPLQSAGDKSLKAKWDFVF